MPISKNPLAPNPNEKGGNSQEGRGSDVNGGVPSQEDLNWARENGRVRNYGGGRKSRRSDDDDDDY